MGIELDMFVNFRNVYLEFKKKKFNYFCLGIWYKQYYTLLLISDLEFALKWSQPEPVDTIPRANPWSKIKKKVWQFIYIYQSGDQGLNMIYTISLYKEDYTH